ncbi:MAG: translation initiation factor IF-2 associated domain-containing protein, partial [Porticoccus sp.]
MAEVTVSELAKVVGASVDRLLSQMQEAGLSHNSADATVDDEEKQKLLAYLKGLHGEASREPKQITLKRKTVSTLKTGAGRKTVNVEVRKKRTYVKRSEEELGSQVDAEEPVVESAPVEITTSRTDDVELQRQTAIETRRKAEEDASLKAEEDRQKEEAIPQVPVEPTPPAPVETPTTKHEKTYTKVDEAAAVDAEEKPKKPKKRGAVKAAKRKNEDLMKAVVDEADDDKKPR